MNTNVREKILTHIGGQKCRGSLAGPVSLLILFLGEILQQMSENKPLRTQWRFWIDCPWRISDGENIIVGYYDDPKPIIAVLKKLQGALLTNVEHNEVCHDIALVFDNNMRLELFSDERSADLWELRGADGYRYTLYEDLEIREWMSEPDGYKYERTKMDDQ